MPPIIPPPPPSLITGGDGGDIVVSGPWEIVIVACIIILFVLIGVMTYSLCRDVWDDYRQDRKMKKEYKKRGKSE